MSPWATRALTSRSPTERRDEQLVFLCSTRPLNPLPALSPASAPRLKRLRSQLLEEGDRLTLKCEAAGNPGPAYTWYKDGTELKKSKEIKIKSSK